MNDLKLFSLSNRRNIFCYLGCFLLVQSCSGSKLGKRLAESFENPMESSVETPLVQTKQSQESLYEEKTLKAKEVSKAKEVKKKPSLPLKKRTLPLANNQLKSSYEKDLSFTPKPYRIIIRLEGVNPSAPAQSVTSALRNAGLIFEIEKIEHLDQKLFLKDSS